MFEIEFYRMYYKKFFNYVCLRKDDEKIFFMEFIKFKIDKFNLMIIFRGKLVGFLVKEICLMFIFGGLLDVEFFLYIDFIEMMFV